MEVQLKLTRLEQVIKLLESCRKKNRFASIRIDVRNHQFVGVKCNVEEFTEIKDHGKTGKT